MTKSLCHILTFWGLESGEVNGRILKTSKQKAKTKPIQQTLEENRTKGR